ncbi:hypothetical protein [Prevotella sp. P5-108]|uniref:hypothetical protein n=1 Tax=Prevotella sp. P5-108 TaxID=2024225 RepID=UPI00117F7FB2|nr:hypothetical protein [Prevotella sp. P5-108]
MKKTLLFLIAATAMMMTGCSNDDFGGATQGMTLNATVEQPASRATMDEGEKGTYKFSFAVNDMLNVTNSQVESYYTFTKQGETFTSTNAQTTTAAADWYAYFPGNTVNLAGQTGDLTGVANYYACAGKTASATTGADGLTIALKPQVAILRIVKVDGNSTTCDINVKTGEKWVSGLTAKSNEAGFDVVTSESKVTLLTASEPGTYYIAVPAGVKIAIYNGGTLVRATQDKGLTAGKYYTLTTGPVRGSADAEGISKPVEWVQLWAGGPKFATQNVAGTMSWTDAVKNKFWGDNWRVPTKDEMGLSANNTVNTEKVSAVYRRNENGVWGFEFTGITPGYTNVSLFLPANPGALESYGAATYWTAPPVGSNNAGYQLSLICDGNHVVKCYYAALGHNGDYYVRPVLVENDNPNTAQ